MAQESLQKKVGRVRPPRVHITYDVETGGAIEKREIPFVVGVLADLSGQPEKALPSVDNRKFIDINRDTINNVMAGIEPRVVCEVPNRLKEAGDPISVELRFKSMDDFQPAKIAEQVPALRQLLDVRRALANLRSSIIGKEKLNEKLQEILNDAEYLERIRSQEGIRASDAKIDVKKES